MTLREDTRRVLVTGVCGNLGTRLVPVLSGFRIIGADMQPGAPEGIDSYHQLDLSQERSCELLVRILRNEQIDAVVHLAFVIDPLRTGVLDRQKMWQINVAGTARVMEAIAEVNRSGGAVRQFIYPSSVSVYGPETPPLVDEDFPMGAHTLAYAVHKREADLVVQRRASSLGACHTYVLRAHIFTGASVQNYLVGALRGTPTGAGRLAHRMRARGMRLPLLLPTGDRYLQNRFQFLHVDDMARLIAFILRQRARDAAGLTLLNVAARGEPLTMEQCSRLANARLLRIPRPLCRPMLGMLWKMGVSGIPPDATPYLIGSFTMNTARLRAFLASDYGQIIRFTHEEALLDSFRPGGPERAAAG